MRRLLIIIVATLAVVVPVAPATAATTCSFNEGTGVVQIASDTDVTIAPSDDAITVDGNQCDAATVTTTETIEIQVLSPSTVPVVTIDVSAQPLGPGATDEGDGSSEIEVSIYGAERRFSVIAGPGNDRVSLYRETELGHMRVNLDDGEADLDEDITLAGNVLTPTFTLGAGDDTFGEVAADGDHLPVNDAYAIVHAGDGDDRVHVTGPGEYDAGPDDAMQTDDDTIDLSWFATDCDVLFHASSESSVFCEIGDDTDFTPTFFESVVGHQGLDHLFAAGYETTLKGRGGDDLIAPASGSETIVGGSGSDIIVTRSPADLTFRLGGGEILGDGHDTFVGIEGLHSAGGGTDRFVGDPPPGLQAIDGGTGHDVVDLAAVDHGLVIRTFASMSDTPEHGLWIADAAIRGTRFADRFVGDPGPYLSERDDFFGGAGDDRIAGGDAADDLRGGPGDDRISGGPGRDTCSGGPGRDVLTGCEN